MSLVRRSFFTLGSETHESTKNVEWIPMDPVASAVLNLIVPPKSPLIVNPWINVFNKINIAIGSQMSLVLYHDWLG